MAIWFENTFAKVWQITKRDAKYTNFKVSTSEKDKKSGEYKNSYWLATAVGHAHNQINCGEVNENDRVTIKKGKITNEPYKDDEGNWKNTVKIVVFEFGSDNDNGSDGGDNPPPKKKKAPPKKSAPEPEEEKSDVISEDELPF